MTRGFQGCATRMEKNQMQDADRLREQVGEMTLRAEVRAQAANDHKEMVLERRKASQREIHKLRFMLEVFAIGERMIHEKKGQLLGGEEETDEIVLGALDDAAGNLGELAKQAQQHVSRNEGALSALQAVEESLAQKATEATARARGMAVQGERAVGVAERREQGNALQGSSPDSLGGSVLVSSSGATEISGVFGSGSRS